MNETGKIEISQVVIEQCVIDSSVVGAEEPLREGSRKLHKGNNTLARVLLLTHQQGQKLSNCDVEGRRVACGGGSGK